MKRSKQAGSSLPITMMFFMVIGMVTMVSVSLTTTTDSMVYRGVQKIQANELAESGIHAMYDRICRKMISGAPLSTTVGSETLSAKLQGNERTLGSYQAEIIDLTYTDTEPAPGQPDGTVLRRYKFTIQGRGTVPNGTYSLKTASFEGEVVANKGAFTDAIKDWTCFPAAIQSNTNIAFIANAGIATLDPASKDKEAHVVANQGVMWIPAIGTKESITDPQVVNVEGHIMVPNEPDSKFFAMTTSPSGMENPNGHKNYQTAAPWTSKTETYAAVKDGITPMGTGMAFPDSKQINAWIENWQSVSTTSANAKVYTGSVTYSDIEVNSDGVRAITAPACIQGNLKLAKGQVLNLIPRSDDPAENIVYVSGDVINGGHIVNNGVILATNRYIDTPEASYRLDTKFTKYPSMEQVYAKSSLVAWGKPVNSRGAQIEINSDVDSQYGTVFALQGYIKVTGNLTMNGMLMSGATEPPFGEKMNYGSLPAAITIAPHNGGGFNLVFVREMKSFSIPGRLVDKNMVIAPFRAASLTDWQQLR